MVRGAGFHAGISHGRRWVLLLVVMTSAAAGLHARAQRPADFTLDQVLNYPFPENLVSAPAGNRVAWTFNERGARNIYVADGAGLRGTQAHHLRSRRRAGALERRVLRRRPRPIVYVRGGDHGSNWPAEGNLEPDPAASPHPGEDAGLGRRASAGGSATSARRRRRAGDCAEDRIASRTCGTSASGSRRSTDRSRRRSLFARGTSDSPVWSPDGRTLAFVSDRGDHSFIALFTGMDAADHVPRALHVARLDARVVAGRDEDRVRASAGQGGVPTLDPPAATVGARGCADVATVGLRP